MSRVLGKKASLKKPLIVSESACRSVRTTKVYGITYIAWTSGKFELHMAPKQAVCQAKHINRGSGGSGEYGLL